MLRYTGAQASIYREEEVGARAAECLGEARTVPFLADAVERANPLISKFNRLALLDRADVDALVTLSQHPRLLKAEKIIVEQGVATNHICLLLDGLAYRYKMLPGGRRQILGYMIPGDLCDPHFTVFNEPDHCVALLCDALVVHVPVARLKLLIDCHPQIARALSLAALTDAAILREWLLNIGQRDAFQRLSHLLCEMAVRFRSIGRVRDDGSFDLPVNQATLADTVGLTSVHTNRVLQRLRSDGLIELRHGRLNILDPDRLVAVAGFEKDYLYIRCHGY